MKQTFETEQEKFWAGEFGNEYISRNADAQIIAGNLHLFSKILSSTRNVKSVIEFGCNIGLNILAIRQLLPKAELAGIEINKKAYEEFIQIPRVQGYNESILEFKIDKPRDFVLVKGVLIHINPDKLNVVYRQLYASSKKYICVAEYYNPQPVELNYRGHTGKLYKRDFAGEILSQYTDLELVDYGFAYHRDNQFPQDDINWFLLKKNEIL